jgi:hypothetical protein
MGMDIQQVLANSIRAQRCAQVDSQA